MGDIAETKEKDVRLTIRALCPAAIERVELFNGPELIETIRPYKTQQPSRRIRVIWQGAECRGRARETIWDGHAELSANKFRKVAAINFWNPEKPLQHSPRKISWKSATAGNFSGFDAYLEEPTSGVLTIDTAPVKQAIKLSEIGYHDTTFEAGGLGKRLRIFRLPEENTARKIELQRVVPLHAGKDNPIYVRVTQQDGQLAWSSPIYLIPPQQRRGKQH